MKYNSIFSLLFLYSSQSAYSQTSGPLNINGKNILEELALKLQNLWYKHPTEDMKPLLPEMLIIKK